MIEQPHRRRKHRLNRLERLVRASLHMHKYSATGILLVLTGCAPPPRFLALSPDGRYAVVPFEATGPAVGAPDRARIILIDLQQRSARAITGIVDSPFWCTTNGRQTIFTTNADCENAPTVIVISDGQMTTIPNAAFPSLSADGRHVVYSRATAPLGDDFNLPIHIHDVQSGEDRHLGIRGHVATFSPDGKTIAFVSGSKQNWHLDVIDESGGQARRLTNFDPDQPGLFVPVWIDNSTLLYRSYATDSPEDTDLFTVSLSGEVKRLTSSNRVSEAFPQVASQGRLVYIAHDGKVEDSENMTGRLTLATPTPSGYVEQSLHVDAFSFAVAGSAVVYTTYDEGTGALMMLDIDQPHHRPVSLNEWVLRDVPGLPEREDDD